MALEVALGYVAADPLLTATYTDVQGGLVVVSADDPGMASSQGDFATLFGDGYLLSAWGQASAWG